jgi:hypothetical protein
MTLASIGLLDQERFGDSADKGFNIEVGFESVHE